MIHRGAKFDFEQVEIETSRGRVLSREVVRHPGAVVIVPVLEGPGGREIVMIRNARIALERWLVELPAGTLERGEAPEAAAGRELEEETGYRAATLRRLGRFHTTPGLTDELMHAFVATDLTFVGQRLEEDERVEAFAVPVASVLRMIESGELEDAKSMLAILLAVRRGWL